MRRIMAVGCTTVHPLIAPQVLENTKSQSQNCKCQSVAHFLLIQFSNSQTQFFNPNPVCLQHQHNLHSSASSRNQDKHRETDTETSTTAVIYKKIGDILKMNIFRNMTLPIPPSLFPTLRAVPPPPPLPPHAIAAATASTIHANFPLALTLSLIAGAATGLGGVLITLQHDLSIRRLGIWQGAAAGFMLSVSIFDLGPAALEDLDIFPASIFCTIGGIIFLLLKAAIPEPDMEIFAKADAASRDVLWSGLLTAAGIALHNFPEGVAVCVASLKGIRFGLPLAVAIGLHNIPEGMAVALPLFFATRNKAYAIKMAFWSGMAEPAGVLFVLGIIQFTGELTRSVVAAMMSAVAGIMIVLSLAELLPQGVRHAGNASYIACFLGLCAMTLMLKAISALNLSVG